MIALGRAGGGDRRAGTARVAAAFGAVTAGPSQATPPGWVFTPGIAVAETWDNNVLLATEGSGSEGDFLTAISPQAALGFRGRLSTFQLDYSRHLPALSAAHRAQRLRSAVEPEYRHRLTPTVTFIARNSLSRSPTTDEARHSRRGLPPPGRHDG